MRITLKTNLPEKHSLGLIKEIIKFAHLNLDVKLELEVYGIMEDVNILAANNVILKTILKEIEMEA